MAEHRAGAQPLAHTAQQKQQQAVADGDADALGDGLFHRLLHAAKAVGQQRLHHQHGQVDAQHQQAHAAQPIQDGVRRQIDHRRTARIEDAAGQQLLFQLCVGRMLLPQGEQAAQQAGQHPGGRQQQSHGNRQHQGVFARGGKHHQRGKAHALHDHGVIQKDAVMVEESFRGPGEEFCSMTFHSASSIHPSRRYRRVSVRSSQPEMLLTVSRAKQTPVSYTP